MLQYVTQKIKLTYLIIAPPLDKWEPEKVCSFPKDVVHKWVKHLVSNFIVLLNTSRSKLKIRYMMQMFLTVANVFYQKNVFTFDHIIQNNVIFLS